MRSSGISALQVAAWHYYDPDPERDRYVQSLIQAWHRHGILVYAWIELPHVSGQFWNAMLHNVLWTVFFLVVPMAMGLFGGVIPAVRASRLPIITALREA